MLDYRKKDERRKMQADVRFRQTMSGDHVFLTSSIIREQLFASTEHASCKYVNCPLQHAAAVAMMNSLRKHQNVYRIVRYSRAKIHLSSLLVQPSNNWSFNLNVEKLPWLQIVDHDFYTHEWITTCEAPCKRMCFSSNILSALRSRILPHCWLHLVNETVDVLHTCWQYAD